jgi:hypothetical protein
MASAAQRCAAEHRLRITGIANEFQAHLLIFILDPNEHYTLIYTYAIQDKFYD